MRVVGLPRAFYHITRHLPPVLTPQAEERWRWLSCWQALTAQVGDRLLGMSVCPWCIAVDWQELLRGGTE